MAFTEKVAGSQGLASEVRRLRAGMGLTQEQFAERLHVTALTVLRWESGQSSPRRLALARLRELEEETANRQMPRSADAAFDVPIATSALDFAGNPDAVSAVAEAYRLAYGHQFNPAFASEISRIDPLPHQRIAVYEHMLPQDPLRFLLADDAGAGKTIMTGLVLREMLSRGRIRRVLVVPPAGLVGNWERELRTLFRLSFGIVTGADARGGNPFLSPGGDLTIVSLDTLAGAPAFARLSSADTPPYDLVVFDEAHKLAATSENRRTRKTRRYRLAEALAGCAPPEGDFSGLARSCRHLLLLTATPHMGKDSPYHHLWRLLDPQVFATGEACKRFPVRERGRHFIRRTKEEMLDLAGDPLFRQRRCDTFDYRLSPGALGEQALYDATTDYLLNIYDRARTPTRSKNNRGAVRLAMGVLQRRMASSTWALSRSFERRIRSLQATVEALRTGRMTASELRREQHDLEHHYSGDFFENRGADDDALDEGGTEANEAYEAAVLGAVATVAIEELQDEMETLKGLNRRARAILDSGNESKFEKLREVLQDERHARERWIIFTEHRDTMDYLVRRLEGLGHAGFVASIHGGMGWPEREREVERFRRPHGARYLVATDAAGEGINLQFCARMANYDIPWNPARLEQRMGRIHRYGQSRDVRIVNLVASSTREGRVLQVLFDKLEVIRGELRSDKVFDVIGRLFENASLKDYMAEALTDDGERKAVARIGNLLGGDRMQAVRAAEEQAYGAAGDVAVRLDGVRGDLERERYLHLLPGYVRRFVEKSAALLGIGIRGDLDGYFAFVPKRPGALDGLLPALEGYPAEARERLCVYRTRPGSAGPGSAVPERNGLEPSGSERSAAEGLATERFAAERPAAARPAPESPAAARTAPGKTGQTSVAAQSAISENPGPAGKCIWLHPGEPVFDALSGQVMAGFAPDAMRGAIFIDPKADAPYLFHLALASVELEAPEFEADRPATASAASRQTLQQCLLAVRQTADGEPLESPLEPLLLLHSGSRLAPGAVPLASRGVSMRAEAAGLLGRLVQSRLVDERRAALLAEMPERCRQVGAGFDLRLAELAAHRVRVARKADGGNGAAAELGTVKLQQRSLSEAKAAALAALRSLPDRIVPGDTRFVLHALAVPATSADEVEQYNERIEDIAVRIATLWERERGTDVRDVSKPALARAAGLADWPGFDLLATGVDGARRHIEVKGRTGRSAIQLEANEWKQACNLGGDYWLYVVFDCATAAPNLVRVRDPFNKLFANRRESQTYSISVAAVQGAAESAAPAGSGQAPPFISEEVTS